MFPEDLTKTGKVRRIPLDRSTLGRLREHRDIAADRAAQCGVRLSGRLGTCSRCRLTVRRTGDPTLRHASSLRTANAQVGMRRRCTHCVIRQRPR